MHPCKEQTQQQEELSRKGAQRHMAASSALAATGTKTERIRRITVEALHDPSNPCVDACRWSTYLFSGNA